ncbi:MAG: hypothetical protein WCO88_08595 [Actinomycetota bacterium]
MSTVIPPTARRRAPRAAACPRVGAPRVGELRVGALAVGIVVAATTLTACGGSDRTEASYCDQVRQHVAAIAAPAIATPADIASTIGIYRTIASHAPAAMQPEWATMIATLELATKADPAKPDTITAATDAALAGTPAAQRIQQYTHDRCAVDIGTPPVPTYPVTATTAAPKISG